MAVVSIALLWIAFAASHMALSSLRLRPRLVARLGEQGFQGIYSLVALATFVPLVWLYFANQHAGPHLWYLGYRMPVRWIAYGGMALALALVVGGLTHPSPASLVPGRGEVKGPLRITRHPLLMGIGLFGLVHLLTANVNAAELVFFAGFPIFTVLGCWHQDQRKRVTLGEPYARFVAETAFLPFGRSGGTAGLGEMSLALAAGVALAVAIRIFHPALFGGAG